MLVAMGSTLPQVGGSGMAGNATKEVIKFKADPVLRRAIRLRGALEDRTITDVIVKALQAHLRQEIAEIRRRGPGGAQPPGGGDRPAPKRRGGHAES
jgi:hypothetical protein